MADRMIISSDIHSAIIQAAREYLSVGRAVIPVNVEKKPLVPWKQYQRSLPTNNDIDDWFSRWPSASIGIVTGQISNLLVVDVDAGNEKRFGEAKDKLDELIPDSLVTPTAKTRRGGLHLWFCRPPCGMRNRTHIGGFSIDVRCDAGYVVVPPSPGYTWLIGPGEAECQEVPPALLEFLHTEFEPAQPKHEPRAKIISIAIDEARKYISHVPPAISGEGGHNQTYRVACLLVNGFALNEQTAWEILQEYNSRCQPPWTDRDLRHKLDEALRCENHNHPRGYLLKSQIAEKPRRKVPGRDDDHDSNEGLELPRSVTQYPLTDLGNAQRLVHRHLSNFRFVPAWDKWIIWDGRKWGRDSSGRIFRLAQETIYSIENEIAAIDPSLDDAGTMKTKLKQHIIKTQARQRIDAMVSIASWQESVPINVSQLDSNPWLLNCPNGTLDLRTGDLRPHAKDDYITKQIGVNYDPTAKCPRWEQFISEIFEGNADLMAFVQRLAGYAFTGDCREEVFAILWGNGLNGKSTFVETLRSILGEYSATTQYDTIIERSDSSGSPRNDLATLVGKRLVCASEGKEEAILAEGTVKLITGRDTIQCRFLYSEFFEFVPEFKLWLNTNHKPRIRGTDEGIWRRILLIPFNVSFKGRADLTLKDKLASELDGILAWAVRGCLEWQRIGLAPPAIVKESTNSYREDSDVLGQFVEECCDLDNDAVTSFTELYSAYEKWCAKTGHRTWSQKSIGTYLSSHGCELIRSKHGRYRSGIKLKIG